MLGLGLLQQKQPALNQFQSERLVKVQIERLLWWHLANLAILALHLLSIAMLALAAVGLAWFGMDI